MHKKILMQSAFLIELITSDVRGIQLIGAKILGEILDMEFDILFDLFFNRVYNIVQQKYIRFIFFLFLESK